MRIHRATIDDLEVLVFLEKACFVDPWSKRALRTALEDKKYVALLADDAGHAVGYALGWSVKDEGELARVAVLPSKHGQGIGKKLTRAILNKFRLRRTEHIFLEVRKSNHAAQNLYMRCGFKEVGRRRKYYADGEDALVMQVELKKA